MCTSLLWSSITRQLDFVMGNKGYLCLISLSASFMSLFNFTVSSRVDLGQDRPKNSSK
jgi:hypothetical protein